MNRQTKAIVNIVTAAVIIFIISIAVYFIGIKFLEEDILAKAGLVHEDAITDWEDAYYLLVKYMGFIAGAILILWTALTHWAFHTSSSTEIGKRWIWVLLGIILIAACVLFPANVEYHGETLAKQKYINEYVQLLFGICYGLFGYWGGSILVTSDDFKYTPLLAIYFK